MMGKNYENVNKPCFFVSLYNTFYIPTGDKYNYVEVTKKCFIAVIFAILECFL